ncbi:lactonase family protein [Planctomycetes bacterium K23_9]|uniref:6-phosphogluconolactonase n=1 Tax=Stieleria marina TaxID=1930275 RepID=A0A517NZB5_9BACT|nr:6-phosphogluconolactonase [Planctomycetes bacterium K23_9]
MTFRPGTAAIFRLPLFSICIAFAIVSMAPSDHVMAQQIDVWFGTSTPKNGLSKGIYHAKFDTDSGKLTKPGLAAEISSPGFLAKHPTLDMLYSVGNVDGKASVAAFNVQSTNKSGTLTFVNSAEIGDGGAAHVSVDRSGKFLMTAQYGSGSAALFELADDGSIAKRLQIEKHQGGSGVVDRRQDKPHAHWTGFSPDNRFAFVPDLGMDKVVIYSMDADAKKISPHGFGICPPGGGPRHMKFHPDGDIIYVLNELALSITAFAYDAKAGTMQPIQTVQTLSDAVKAKETFNSASEIRVHPSGKFVYSANRGHDSISVFSVDQSSRQLTFVEWEPIRGGWPRNFNLDPTGKWIIVAGQDSNTATVFKIDPTTGELTFTRETAMVPSSICVEF